MNVKDIIYNFLKRSSYDGLYNQEANCTCLIENLCPYCENPMDCKPGYVAWCEGNGQCDWCDRGDERHWWIQDRPLESIKEEL